MGRVAGKIAIVTGAASGLGAAHALELARQGATVVLADVNKTAGQTTAERIPGAIFYSLDVRDEERWIEVISEVRHRFGKLDILVNNAGIVRFANIEDCTLDDYRLVNAVNAEGTFLGCKHAIPAMVASGGGAIVNTASVAAIRARSLVPAYSASKGAVISLTRSIAFHCKERGYNIRCNAIVPGSHETGMAVQARIDLPDDVRGGLAHAKNLHHGDPAETANLVVFLCSGESASVNGTAIVVDNGQLLG